MVTDEYPRHVAHISPCKSSAQFEADLEYLTKHYEVIGYEELCERRAGSEEQRARKNGSTSPALRSRLSALRPSVVLTFDDGYRECFEVVRPLLLKYKVPAIFFVTTDFIDNRQLFFRNKVSLCIDRILGLSESEWRVAADRVRCGLGSRFQVPGSSKSPLTPNTSHLAPNSSPTPETRYPTPANFIHWLKDLPHDDEPTINDVCQILDIDTHLFLREHRPYLTTAQIEQLIAEGFTIGAHGVTHARLSDLIGEEPRAGSEECSGVRDTGCESTSCSPVRSSLTPETRNPKPSAFTRHLPPFDSEIVDSCRVVAELTGRESVPFAFPFSGDGVPRADLAAIRDKHPHVAMIFDRRGFRADVEFVVHRIIADSPLATPEQGTSNLRALVHREYVREARAAISRARRSNGVPHRPTRVSHPASDTLCK